MSDDEGIKGRVTRQGEEAIGKVTQGMLENPVVTRALSAAFETRQRATRAQEVAMGALNLPSAGDLERLDQRLEKLTAASALDERLTAIDELLARIEASLGAPAAQEPSSGLSSG